MLDKPPRNPYDESIDLFNVGFSKSLAYAWHGMGFVSVPEKIEFIEVTIPGLELDSKPRRVKRKSKYKNRAKKGKR